MSHAELDHALLESLLLVNDRLRASIDALMDDLDLSESLANAVWHLTDEPVPRGALASRLRCDPSNVTFLVDRLEQRGLVMRVADPHDRRVKAIKLTSAGEQVQRTLVAAAASSPAIAGLTPTQKTHLHDLLQVCLAQG